MKTSRPIIFRQILTWDHVISTELGTLRDPGVIKALGDRKVKVRSADLRRLQYLLHNNESFKAWLGDPDPNHIRSYGLPVQYRLGHINEQHEKALEALSTGTPKKTPFKSTLSPGNLGDLLITAGIGRSVADSYHKLAGELHQSGNYDTLRGVLNSIDKNTARLLSQGKMNDFSKSISDDATKQEREALQAHESLAVEKTGKSPAPAFYPSPGFHEHLDQIVSGLESSGYYSPVHSLNKPYRELSTSPDGAKIAHPYLGSIERALTQIKVDHPEMEQVDLDQLGKDQVAITRERLRLQDYASLPDKVDPSKINDHDYEMINNVHRAMYGGEDMRSVDAEALDRDPKGKVAKYAEGIDFRNNRFSHSNDPLGNRKAVGYQDSVRRLYDRLHHGDENFSSPNPMEREVMANASNLNAILTATESKRTNPDTIPDERMDDFISDLHHHTMGRLGSHDSDTRRKAFASLGEDLRSYHPDTIKAFHESPHGQAYMREIYGHEEDGDEDYTNADWQRVLSSTKRNLVDHMGAFASIQNAHEHGYPKEFLDRAAKEVYKTEVPNSANVVWNGVGIGNRVSRIYRDLTDHTAPDSSSYRKNFAGLLSSALDSKHPILQEHKDLFTARAKAPASLKRSATIWGDRKALVEASRDDVLARHQAVQDKFAKQIDKGHQEITRLKKLHGIAEHEDVPGTGADSDTVREATLSAAHQYALNHPSGHMGAIQKIIKDFGSSVTPRVESAVDNALQHMEEHKKTLTGDTDEFLKKVYLARTNPDAQKAPRSSYDIDMTGDEDPHYVYKHPDSDNELHVRDVEASDYASETATPPYRHYVGHNTQGGYTQDHGKYYAGVDDDMIHRAMMKTFLPEDKSRALDQHLEHMDDLDYLKHRMDRGDADRVMYNDVSRAIRPHRAIEGRLTPHSQGYFALPDDVATELHVATNLAARHRALSHVSGASMATPSAILGGSFGQNLSNYTDTGHMHQGVVDAMDGMQESLAHHATGLNQRFGEGMTNFHNLQKLNSRQDTLAKRFQEEAHKAQDDLIFHDIANGTIPWHTKLPQVIYHGTPIAAAHKGDLFDISDYAEDHTGNRLGPGVYTTADYRVARDGYAKVPGASGGNYTQDVHPYTFTMVSNGKKWFDAEKHEPGVQKAVMHHMYNSGLPEHSAFKSRVDRLHGGNVDQYHESEYSHLDASPQQGNKHWYDDMTHGDIYKSHINKSLQSLGYDGVTHVDRYYPNKNSWLGRGGDNGHRVFVAFDRKSVKSLYGNQDFKPEEKNVFKAAVPIVIHHKGQRGVVHPKSLWKDLDEDGEEIKRSRLYKFLDGGYNKEFVQPSFNQAQTRSIPMALPHRVPYGDEHMRGMNPTDYPGYTTRSNSHSVATSTLGIVGGHLDTVFAKVPWKGDTIHHIGSTEGAGAGGSARHLIHTINPEETSQVYQSHLAKAGAKNIRVDHNPEGQSWGSRVHYSLGGSQHEAHFFRGRTPTPQGKPGEFGVGAVLKSYNGGED